MLTCRGSESALAGRYMRWELLIFLTEKGLTAMRNRTTLLRAEQSRAEQSRAEQRLTAPFLRLAGRLKLNTTFEIDNRRI